MLRYAVRRVLLAIPLLLLVSLFVFALLDFAPGDAAVQIAGEEATAEQIQATRERLGLGDPLPVRYAEWMSDALRRDLGTSFYTDRPVWDMIAERIPVTLSITLGALLITIVFGLPLGILAAARANTLLDRLVTLACSFAMAVPTFVFGLFLVAVFAVRRDWLPATGYVGLADGGFTEWGKHILLPALALSPNALAEVTRHVRGAVLGTFRSDYVRTARSKGLRTRRVVLVHALRNAAIPIVTVVGIQLGHVLGATVVIESIFAIPGYGQLAFESVVRRDVPMIQGIVLTSACVVLLSNILVDLSYGLLNPQLREDHARGRSIAPVRSSQPADRASLAMAVSVPLNDAAVMTDPDVRQKPERTR